MYIDPAALFDTVRPGFFQQERIRNLPPEQVYVEQVMDLKNFSADAVPLSWPKHITFGLYTGDMESLRAAAAQVNVRWAESFTAEDALYCAYDGEKIVSFCRLSDFGAYHNLRVGGPGCVGTLKEYRRQGIGLKLVQNATAILKEQGYDLGYIHYTAVGHWYARLGYETILKWNCNGILEE